MFIVYDSDNIVKSTVVIEWKPVAWCGSFFHLLLQYQRVKKNKSSQGERKTSFFAES